jgi:hypothetical protein
MTHFVYLEIDHPDLEIHCFESGWRPQYAWRLDIFIWDFVRRRYGLVRQTNGGPYKFFVLLAPGQGYEEVREIIEKAGYAVTGNGDHDSQSGRRKLWFFDPHKPTQGEGVWTMNVL